MSVTVARYQNFVGGEWVDAVEGETTEILNPATGETIAEVPQGAQADVDRAVEAAKRALAEWRETTPGERAEVLLEARRPDRGARRGARADRVAERGQADLRPRATRCRSAPTTSASSPARRASSRAAPPAST